MSERESNLKQVLGPKKYKEKVEAANKHYDRYMAGKKNPKTGEYYNEINFNDPRTSKYRGAVKSVTIGYVKCIGCEAEISVGSNSMGKCCLYCGEYNFFSTELKESL